MYHTYMHTYTPRAVQLHLRFQHPTNTIHDTMDASAPAPTEARPAGLLIALIIVGSHRMCLTTQHQC